MRRVWLGSGAALLLLIGAAFLGFYDSCGCQPAPLPLPPVPPLAAPAAVPAAPAIAPRAPSFDIVRIDPGGQTVIAGRAAPDAQVRVMLDGGTLIGEARADWRGEWAIAPAAPLAPGDHQLTLEATGAAAGVVLRSNETVAVTVAPPGGAGPAVAVLLPNDPGRAARLLQQPEPTGAASALSLDTAEIVGSDRLLLSGHAAPGARLRLFAGDGLLTTLTADAQGRWTASARRPAAAGSIELRIDQLAADGSLAQRVTRPFAPPAAMAALDGQSYTVRRGDTLWWIARQIYGQGPRYTVIYLANREQIHDPNRIQPGLQVKLPRS
jgi:nucleoid-associated protein YgaU